MIVRMLLIPADLVPWNQDLFDDDLNSALQTRVFADLKDQKHLDQWTKELSISVTKTYKPIGSV